MGTYNRLTPNLMVDDVAETMAWYEAVLGAEELARMPPESDDPEWGQVEFGDVWLMFQTRDSLEGELPVLAGRDIGGSFSMYVDTDDAEAVHERGTEAGASVVQELHETEYGRREFAIEDCNGYVLAFGQKLEWRVGDSTSPLRLGVGPLPEPAVGGADNLPNQPRSRALDRRTDASSRARLQPQYGTDTKHPPNPPYGETSTRSADAP